MIKEKVAKKKLSDRDWTRLTELLTKAGAKRLIKKLQPPPIKLSRSEVKTLESAFTRDPILVASRRTGRVRVYSANSWMKIRSNASFAYTALREKRRKK